MSTVRFQRARFVVISSAILFAALVSPTMILRRVPRPLVARVGDNVTLECAGRSSEHGGARYACSWQKDGAVVFVGEGMRRTFYDWAGNASAGECSIVLHRLQVARHHGRWSCTVVNTELLHEHAVTAPVQLIVLAAPMYPEIQDSTGLPVERLTVVENRIKQLHCVSRGGNPAASLSWSLDGSDVTGNATAYNNSEPTAEPPGEGYVARTYTAGSWLPLRVNRSRDGATLRCTARHDAFGRDAGLPTVQLRVDVTYPPTNMSDDVNVTAPLSGVGGDDFRLECPLQSKPEASYTWYSVQPPDDTLLPLASDRFLLLSNLSEVTSGGYKCSASNVLERGENRTAFSGLFRVFPDAQFDAHDAGGCGRDDVAFSLAVILGACALLSLAIEVMLLIHFRKDNGVATNTTTTAQSAMSNVFYELYRTRGRKTALVHVHATQDAKGGKGFSLHLSSSLISILMAAVDVVTIAASATAVVFCLHSDYACGCSFSHPAVVVTLVFGALVVLCQISFLVSFCQRKREDSKYRTYAKNKEDVVGSATHSSVRTSGAATRASATKSGHKNGRNETRNQNGSGEMPGTVPNSH